MHRLFLACPIPEEIAIGLHSWARTTLPNADVRAIPVENMHVTLLFFGELKPLAKTNLTDLALEASWPGIQVWPGAIGIKGKNAVALNLKTTENEPAEGETPSQPWLDTIEPFKDMSRRLGRSDNERRFKRFQERKALVLHTTLARTLRDIDLSVLEGPVEIPPFTLDRLVLYESFMEPDGPRYEVVAESRLS